MGWHKERKVRENTRELLAEIEDMLSGYLLGRRWWEERRPGWLWLNPLAHGDGAALAALASGTPGGRGSPSTPSAHSAWDSALMFLATEMLATARDPEALVALQRSEIVPLELELLARHAAGCVIPSTPAELVNLVRPRIARARRRQRHAI